MIAHRFNDPVMQDRLQDVILDDRYFGRHNLSPHLSFTHYAASLSICREKISGRGKRYSVLAPSVLLSFTGGSEMWRTSAAVILALSVFGAFGRVHESAQAQTVLARHVCDDHKGYGLGWAV